ncbi:MAG: PorV/PorQ family protein [Bacteroidia bacterium]|nr:PorV/PorQ family protein [Bacteroidia bacterium]
MKLIALSFLTILVIHSTAFAQAPKYSNEFLQIGVGARSLGMSGAQVASVNDVTSGYWNPAGLTGISNTPQLALMHAEYFAGIAKYDYGAFAKRIDSSSVLALSVVRFGVDNIPNTTELIDANGIIDYNRISSFSAADYAFIGSYARNLKVKGLSVGGSAKVVRRIIGKFANSWGFGIDAGLQYKRNQWQFGLTARDITTTFNAWNVTLDDKTKATFIATGNTIPTNSQEITLPRFLVGVARNIKLNKNFNLLAEINADITTDGKRNVVFKSNSLSLDPHAGVELNIYNLVYVRAGVGNITKQKDILQRTITTAQPNVGLGLKFRSICIDYAFTDIGNSSTAIYSNIFSLKFDINKARKKQA